MMVLVNWDFIGSDEELKEGDKTFKKMADIVQGSRIFRAIYTYKHKVAFHVFLQMR